MTDQTETISHGRPTAIVTGASRGIGKASAIALAEAGYDVAITARTVKAGTGPVADTVGGSLEETAAAIDAVGGTAHVVAMDLLDAERVPAAATECLAALGHVDLLLNNAIYVAVDGQRLFLDIPIEQMQNRIFGNVTAQLLFTQPIVAEMVANGGGTVLNMTSAAGYVKPWATPLNGGPNLVYAMAKGGFHRMAPQLDFEYRDQGIRALNVQPGFVATERVRALRGTRSLVADIGVETSIIGAAVAHVATHIDMYDPMRTVQLQQVAVELGLLDEIPMPSS